MKKILLATTALVGFAGAAAAEVSLSGDARMGVLDNFSGDVEYSSRARVKFTLTGETDGGLSFGGSFRADNATGAAAGTAGSVYISGTYGKLEMGDVDGAAKSVVGHVDGVGYTGLSDLNESTYIANVGTTEGVLYTYSMGDFTFAASSGQIGIVPISPWSIGVGYNAGNYAVGLGYEDNDNGTDHVIVGGSATFGAVTLKANYGKASGTVDGDQWAVSATYSMDAVSATVFYTDDSDLGGVEAYGIGAGYDLGGGAMLKGGYVKDETNNADGFDLGVTFSF